MNEKNLPNRYKEPAEKTVPPETAGETSFYSSLLKSILLICVFSLSALFVHDVVVQSPFFTVRQVNIQGEHRVKKEEILILAELSRPVNFFQANLPTMEKRIASHPWISSATVRRSLFSTLTITVEEQHPLAIVRIENFPDMIINQQGVPFKAYEPEMDQDITLPVITGLDLTSSDQFYHFEGPLFNAVLDLLQSRYQKNIISIHGDDLIGITVQATGLFNPSLLVESRTLPICLGFDDYERKFVKALQISQYILANIPGKTICAMDLFEMDTVFVKTAQRDSLHATIEKGV
ncbi:MAG: FtsQ-type POTRA domain-containing protein [Desulfotignum sp.]|nr:FtsQ-type POTRA domain-containing protein [Desulfotignum sp.]